MIDINKIYNQDCLEGKIEIPDKSIDMICYDLPYGVLNKFNNSAKWDCTIPFDKLWLQYERIIKDDGAIALYGQGVFSAKLMLNNEKLYRYSLIWGKDRPIGFLNSKRMPLRSDEDILVFYKTLGNYKPQMYMHPTVRITLLAKGYIKKQISVMGKMNVLMKPLFMSPQETSQAICTK